MRNKRIEQKKMKYKDMISSQKVNVFEILRWIIRQESSDDLPVFFTMSKNNFMNTIKTVFWFSVAILTGFLLANICS